MKTTLEMAREVGFAVGHGSPALAKFERLIAMARADEREACAKVCEQKDEEFDEGPDQWDWHSKDYAAAIRAR
jgi:hypothetical protein